MFLSLMPEAGYLYVVAAGKFSLEDGKRTFLELLDALAHHGSCKALVDGRGVEGELTTMQRFYYSEFAARAAASFTRARGLPEAPRFAYVLAEPVLDPQRFGETVAVNRGMRVRVFDNIEDALRWLEA